MKKPILLTILVASSMLLWSQNTVNYTVTAKEGTTVMSLDSVVLENVTAAKQAVVKALPAASNVITISKVTTSVAAAEVDETFALTRQQPGKYVIHYAGSTPTQARVAVYNLNGQTCMQQQAALHTGSTLEITVGATGIYMITVQAEAARPATFKVIGAAEAGSMQIKSAGTADTKSSLPTPAMMTPSKAPAANFSVYLPFSTGDQIKVTVYKKGYIADPQTKTMAGDETLEFQLKEGTTLPDISDGGDWN